MAGINISGTGQEDKKPVRYPTTSTGAQGSTVTGTNVFGGAIPNSVGALKSQKPATEPPAETPKPEQPKNPGGNTGAGSSTSSNSSNRTLVWGSGTRRPILGNYFGNIGQQEAPEIINESEKKAETALADLKNSYAQRLRDDYDYSANMLRQERDNALRENWILQQQAEAALPEQMAAAGINGGASETTLADLRARYEGNRNDIRGNYMDEVGKLSQQNAAAQAEAQQNYNEKWLEYLLSLARAEEQQLKGY
ncbi:MAG: hypothetical protein IIW81_05175 [Oscillospiraceae bacterium]|nr:hypothetical protein [Oscillospiraceae bacterium]